MPLVDVLLPVYNGEYELERCISSIASDALPDFQGSRVLVVDDGSSDNTSMVIEALKIKYDEVIEIKHIKSAKNQGIAGALSLGLKHCSSDIVYRMDVDDTWMSGRFREQYAALSRSEVGIVGGSALSVSKKDRFKAYLPREVKLFDFLVASPCIHPAIAFKRSALVRTEYIGESPFDDYIFLIENALKNVKIINLSKPVISYNDKKLISRLSVQKEDLMHAKFLKIRILLMKHFLKRKLKFDDLNNDSTLFQNILVISNAKNYKNRNIFQSIITNFLSKVISKTLRLFFYG